MTDLNTAKIDILEEEGEGGAKVVPENQSEAVIKVEKEGKGKYFPCGLCENISRTKSSMELHMKRKHNNKVLQYTPGPTNRNVGYTWFSCKSCKVKKRTENELNIHYNTMHMSITKVLPKGTKKRPIQSYNCKDCNSTFDSFYKLTKHIREQYDGKVVKSPERKSPRTESKKSSNSNKEDVEEHSKHEEEKTDVETVTIDVKELENLQDLLTTTGQKMYNF